MGAKVGARVAVSWMPSLGSSSARVSHVPVMSPVAMPTSGKWLSRSFEKLYRLRPA